MARMDKELQRYRDLMQVPDRFEDGFGGKTIVGAIFLGFLMVPGTIYLSLFMGAGLGPAAQWVTVILFSEIVKRSMKSLRKQEIFVLFYMTGITLSMPFPLLWNQYFVQSAPAVGMGIAHDIPRWFAPPRELIEAGGRSFFTDAWVTPMFFMAGMLLLQRIDQFGLGYALYRLTAHVEKLPFPMAPVGALGVTALAESRDSSERWRWRMFSLGGVMGLAFGVIYAGLPALTGAVFATSVKIIPIPWLDLTPYVSTQDFLPAVPLNLVFDLTLVLTGMVLPFWAVVGGFLGFVATLIVNPVLYRNGLLTSWRPGMSVVDTTFSNSIDFYLSFGIGLTLAIFLISLLPIVKPLLRLVAEGRGRSREAERRTVASRWAYFRGVLVERSRERGDLSILTSLIIYVTITFVYIGICRAIVPNFPVWFFLGFGFIYQPIISYVNAKLEGVVGLAVAIPLIRESAYILSGYKGAAIWFAPVPISDYGTTVRNFRIMELTGTRLTSLLKTEVMVFPILVLTTILFSHLIWRLAPVPSEAYPFTQEVWQLQALTQALTITSTLDGSSLFLEAIKPGVIGWGVGVGAGTFALLSFLHLPTLLVYGVVWGLGGTIPGVVVPQMIGALLSRLVFEPRFGAERFKKYAMVILAGFMAGVGLIGMSAVAIALIAKSTTTLGY